MMFTRRTLAIMLAVLAVGGLLAAGGVPPVSAQADGETDLPASYYGTVTINGEPADPGVVIEAEIDGEVRGSITVSEAGQYGGADAFAGKLDVTGATDADAGAPVTFYVNGETFDRTEVTTDPTDVTWESGAVQEVSLSAEVDFETGDDTPTTPPDDDEDDTDDQPPADDEESTQQPATDTDPVVAEDPNEIAEVLPETVELPANETVERAEVNTVTGAPETNQSQVTFSNESSTQKITFSESVSGTAAVIELSTEPEETGTAPGQTVSVSQIEVPDDAAESSATIESAVPRDRISDLGVSPESLTMTRYNDETEQWEQLETTVATTTETAVVLEAQTPGFSVFAVTAVAEPEAAFTVAPPEPTAGDEVQFDAGDSTVATGEIVAYEWTIDGQSLTGETVSVTLEEAGTVTAELTVETDAGETATTSQSITVQPAEEQPSDDEGLFPVPGFGVGIAVLAVLGGALLARARR